MGGKNARNNISRKTIIVRAKNCWQKFVGKSAKQRFLYLDEYRDKKWEGGNNARNNFYRKTRIVPAKNVAKKFIEKSAKKRFLYSHEYHAQKMGEKNAK